MNTRDPNDVLADRVAAIRALPATRRAQAVDGFLRDYAAMVDELSRRMVRHSGGAMDDARSIVMEAAWTLLDQDGDGPEIFNFPGLLVTASRSAYTRALDADRGLGVVGMVSRQRRQRSLGRARLAYVQMHGCAPTDQQLIDFHNAALRARRADAAGQGALASLEDLEPIGAGDLEDQPLGTHPDGGILTQAEGNDLVQRTIDRAAAEDPVLGKVAQAFLGGHLAHPGQIEQRLGFVAREAGVSMRNIGALVSRVQQIAVDVFREMTGG